MNAPAKSERNADRLSKAVLTVFQFILLAGILLLCARDVEAATYFVNAGNPAPTPPYTSWLTAATNIQDAITMTTNGDTVLVTNGVYAFGGATLFGVTNRIAATNAITVESVNGPWMTTILGEGMTNGSSAVRCAWLTNGASLIGFTLTGGATPTSGNVNYLSGGGVWSASSNAYIQNCVIVSNTAEGNSGAVYQGTLSSCLIRGNSSTARNGAIYGSVLNNCTIVSNNTDGVISPLAMTNCIIYYNPINCLEPGVASHCCTTPALTGTGNFTNAPLLFVDGVHLANGSPCIGAGVYIGGATDIFSEVYSNPPSVGCAEWSALPMVLIPQIKLTSSPIGFTIGNVAFTGATPCAFSWLLNGQPLADNGHYSGTQTTNLVATGVSLADAGSYQVVVSNAFGAVTSSVVTLAVHAVNASGTNPLPPYSSWANAATTIQDAVNAAASGDIVLVTNGVYFSGGMALVGTLTNRVALNKAVMVISFNGYKTTTIQGAWDPVSTNGPNAVRCAYVSDGAVLEGFTLENGATFASGDGYQYGPLESGGGVLCNSTNGLVLNCELTNNSAIYGGGAAYGTVDNSLIVGNQARYGGGALFSSLNNCTVVNNTVWTPSPLNYGGAGTCSAIVRNSIVVENYDSPDPQLDDDYYAPGSPASANYAYSCSSGYRLSLPSGAGNTNADPVFIDLYHISTFSPCYGAGSAAYSTGDDLDGQPWNTPPSMGCSEIVLSNLVGPLAVNCSALYTNMIVNGSNPMYYHYDTLYGTVQGRAAFLSWSFGDGPVASNIDNTCIHEWSSPGSYPVTFTAYNNDNPNGVSTTLVVNVQSPLPAQIQSFALQANGMAFQFPGQMDAIYIVQYSTNLTPPISWQTLQQIYYNTQPVIQMVDTNRTSGARFYRVTTQ